ncbi:MAG: 2OG-Fe(II) oxygenase [Alphaproteobacteria bacterium]|nr:2OG-Fe(II) oxygenase [Alphaproteobacteria bacterium]
MNEIVDSADAAALTALGKRLLTGDGIPMDADRGTVLIATAAHQGDGEAATLAAVLIGLGANSLADWTKALEYLQQAAESGWSPAQRQLMVLGNSALLDEAHRAVPPPDIWGRLRRSIDVASWGTLPQLRQVSDAPRIEMRDAFLPPRICQWLMDCARGGLERSRVFAPTGKTVVENSRTNSAFEVGLLSLDMVMLLTRARIAAATGFSPQALEHTNILHYAPGQQFSRHFDFLDPGLPGHAQEIAAKGQRVGTFLVYLNEDYAGAETEFALLNQRYRCPTGGALFFRNVDPSAVPDRQTLHAGLPPASGEKWLLSQWIRGQPSGR